METWGWTCLLLCLFGFFKEMRPSEPFLTEYLMGPWKNLTSDQVNHQIYPVWTYSYLALLVVVFLVTDYFRYKPIVVLEGFSFIATWCVLIWGQGVPAMQSVEFLYAMGTSTQVAYSTYIYAQVPKASFQIVTSFTQAALLTGRCIAGIVGQALVLTEVCNYYSLNFISLASVCVATVFAIVLPSVSRSIYFHRDKVIEENLEIEPVIANDQVNLTITNQSKESQPAEVVLKLQKAGQFLLHDFWSAYSNSYLLKWSVWWAFATCGNLQVLNYIQSLWESIDDNKSIYNGSVEAFHTLLSALCAVGIGYLAVPWNKYGEGVLAVISFIEGVVLYLAALTSSIYVCYGYYIVFCISYQVIIAVASAEVAKQLKQHSYGLIFGINTFVALLLQTILTFIIADEAGLGLPIDVQFKVLGVYYSVLGAVFLFMVAFGAGRRDQSVYEVNE